MMAIEAFCIKRPGLNGDSKPGKKFLFFENILIWARTLPVYSILPGLIGTLDYPRLRPGAVCTLGI
jgi:hypothetical protein